MAKVLAMDETKAKVKGSGMGSTIMSGRFPALVLAASLAFGFSSALATDTPAKADKPAAQGVVAEKAIHADGGGDCAKAKEDCPKEAKADCCPKGAKEAKADCCPKGAKGAKDGKGAGHHGKHEHKSKGAEAKASPSGADKPADQPAEEGKGASHPG